MNFNIPDDELNRTLAASGEIVPSSGFITSVMEAVQQEATAPAPIPFPWKWAMPGLIASLALIVYLLVRLVHADTRAGYNAAAGLHMESLLSFPFHGVASTPLLFGIEWSVLALVASFVVVRLSMGMGRE